MCLSLVRASWVPKVICRLGVEADYGEASKRIRGLGGPVAGGSRTEYGKVVEDR